MVLNTAPVDAAAVSRKCPAPAKEACQHHAEASGQALEVAPEGHAADWEERYWLLSSKPLRACLDIGF